MIKDKIEEEIIEKNECEELLEDDEIDPIEAAFMRGYKEAEESKF